MYIYLALLASVIGLGVSAYIYRKKRAKLGLMCPRRSKCDEVVQSIHAMTFGINNEVLGMAFYTLLGILWASILIFPVLATGIYVLVVVMLTIFGMLFSIYLIALQAFVIRAWCVWCLVSAFANILLVVALFGLPRAGLYELLADSRVWWVIFHNIGFIFALGAATITDIFFFRFLKDHKITLEEKGVMDTLTSVIWTGLGILIVSGIMLYLPEQVRLNESAKFLLKVIVVGIIIINGFLLNLFIAPKLHQLSFENTIPATRYRRVAFALGGISMTSWYTAFLLGSLRKIDYTLTEALLGYGAVIVAVIVGSQMFERIATAKMRVQMEREEEEGTSHAS